MASGWGPNQQWGEASYCQSWPMFWTCQRRLSPFSMLLPAAECLLLRIDYCVNLKKTVSCLSANICFASVGTTMSILG